MDCFSDDMGSADTDNVKSLSLRDQRIRVEQLERQNQSEYSAVKEILENEHELPRAAKILGNSLPNPRPSLQNTVEKQQRRLCTLIEQHNGLHHMLRLKETQLLEMEQTMKSLETYSIPNGDERQYDQRVRQLENCLEKMAIKFTEAENVHSTYLQIQEHLHQEVREMPHVLAKLQSTVISGQSELSKVAQLSQAAVAAVESTKGVLVQLERQLMMERWAIEEELNTKQMEKERKMEGRMDSVKEGDRRISRAPQKLKDQRKSILHPKDGITAIINPAAARGVVHQSATQPDAQQSNVKMVKEMDDLKEALGCTELQELESRLLSQRATWEQLHTQMKQCEEQLAQRQETLATLELQYAQIKFNPGPSGERFEQMQAELCAELEQESQHCLEWEMRKAKARAVLQHVEQGVNNLFYRVTCLPITKEAATTEASLDALEKLQEIDSRLPLLVDPEKTEEAGTNDKLWTFLVQSTMAEPRNCKRANSPTYNSNSEDTFQFRSQEEHYSLSRNEIKRRNKQLIEAHQPKKKTTKGSKKS